MSTPASTVFRRTEPDAVAVEVNRLFFAVDPVSGHLYPTSEVTDILPREDAATGHLYLTDDTSLTAARCAVNSTRARIY